MMKSSVCYPLLVACLLCFVVSVCPCPSACQCGPTQQGTGTTTACIDSHLTDVPHNIPSDTVDLYFRGNMINTLESRVFSNLRSLHTLLITESQVREIEPHAFDGLVNLSFLNLEKNQIGDLASYTFSGLSGLRRLILNQNSMRAIKNYAFHGLNLTHLKLEQTTKLRDISSQAFQSCSIIELRIHNCSLGSASLGSLRSLRSSLRELTLEHNQIPLIIPQNLFDGFVFRSLKLSHNGIRDTSFLEYVVTDDLSLEGNPTGPIDFSRYSTLKQIRTIRLANTGFHTLDGKYFKGMAHLTHLHLSGNHIMTLPENLTPVFNHLQRLTLDNNYLYCNCELAWFNSWLMSASAIVEGAACAEPFVDDLVFVKQEDMKCTAPTITEISPHVKVSTSQQLTLSCKANGNPPPRVTWRQPSGAFTVTSPSYDRNVTWTRGILNIGSTRKDDQGVYICVAQNAAGNITQTTDVTVNVVAGQSQSHGNELHPSNGHPGFNTSLGYVLTFTCLVLSYLQMNL